MKSLAANKKGFTIIELMIATAVFAVVLLLSTYGLLEIGRMYYKGVTATRTQNAARRVLEDAAEAIKFNGGAVERHEANGWHCVGTKRYSFQLGRQLTTSNHALVSDTVSSCSSGTGRQGNIDGGALTATSTELLDTRMRLARFSIEPTATAGVYTVTVRIVSGDNDLLDDAIGSDGILDTCKNVKAGTQFCSVSELTTTVQKRV